MSGRARLFGALAATGLASGTPIQAATPQLTPAQVVALFTAAGFPLGTDKRPVNRCGQSANPKVTFVDMNGDGRQQEALFIDGGPCYKPDGRWYAIAAQSPDGNWHRILEGEGSVAATGTAFRGWFVLTATGAGKTTRLHFDGAAYVPADGAGTLPPAAAGATPRGSATTAPARAPGRAPIDFTIVFGDDATNQASVKALPPAAKVDIFRAAGLTQVAKGKWTGCTDDDTHMSEADIALVADINGDGRKEAVVQDSGTYCNGNTGVNSILLTQDAAGRWKTLTLQQGFFIFLKSKGVDGYPDIEIGMPGLCFPYLRWDGHDYSLLGSFSDDHHKPCRG